MDFSSSSDFDFAAPVLSAKGAGAAVSADAAAETGFAAAAKAGDRAAFDYVLGLIHSETLSPTQQVQVMHDTLECWQDHVNGGFLKCELRGDVL